jgi:hypothetical protein
VIIVSRHKSRYQKGTDTLLDRSDEEVERLSREVLSNRAGPSSPFGDQPLPMPVEDVEYQLPGAEGHAETTEQY